MQIRKIHTCTGHRAALYALARSRDDRHFLTAGGDGWIVEWSLDDPETGLLIASVDVQVYALCTLENGNRLVAGNMNGGVHWIDRDTPAETRNVLHHKKGVYDIVAIDNQVFTAGGDGVLTRWTADTAQAVESYRLANAALRAIAFSEKRRELAVGASNCSIYVLDAETLALKRTLQNAHGNSVFSVDFSPDGRYLLSAGRDAMLRVWDLENDFLLVSGQAAHLFTVNHIVFSPNGQWFATASRDKTLKIWDACTFQLLKVVDTIRYGAHINSVNRLLWLPDCLVSCSDDRSAMLWSVTAS